MDDKAETIDALRSVFWQGALTSGSLLLWIVTHLAETERPAV